MSYLFVDHAETHMGQKCDTNESKQFLCLRIELPSGNQTWQ